MLVYHCCHYLSSNVIFGVSTIIICPEEIDILIDGKNIVGLIIDIICYQELKIQTVTLTSKLKSSVAEKG